MLSNIEFSIPKHTLDIIYSQTICWMGLFFSPLISLITFCQTLCHLLPSSWLPELPVQALLLLVRSLQDLLDHEDLPPHLLCQLPLPAHLHHLSDGALRDLRAIPDNYIGGHLVLQRGCRGAHRRLGGVARQELPLLPGEITGKLL